ncbi:RNA chaperone Hfq [Acidipila sp. EB88]|uniref:RNA chaperone Hfq n=1 Tax=Acidipila sp. EB88 TaxID=2305226 RepID=UPI0013154F6C|nr:RNA chaperone Hfq [Acidipila sp. EB88]
MAQAPKLFDVSAAAAKRPVFVRSSTGGGPLSAAPLSPVAAPPPAAELQPIDAGPRKLVRPRLPENTMLVVPPRRLRGPSPLVRHAASASPARPSAAAASHAEALYFQKQIQAQTRMVFVLEDGEQIQGVVEWFDQHSIKIRNHTRTLIFKRTIKYLYKAGEDS